MSELRSAREMMDITEQNADKLENFILAIKDEIIEAIDKAAFIGLCNISISISKIARKIDRDNYNLYSEYLNSSIAIFSLWLEDAGYAVISYNNSTSDICVLEDELYISWNVLKK